MQGIYSCSLYLYLNLAEVIKISIPIVKKSHNPIIKNDNTPIIKNDKDNNTIYNNTINNKYSANDAQDIWEVYLNKKVK